MKPILLNQSWLYIAKLYNNVLVVHIRIKVRTLNFNLNFILLLCSICTAQDLVLIELINSIKTNFCFRLQSLEFFFFVLLNFSKPKNVLQSGPYFPCLECIKISLIKFIISGGNNKMTN